MIKITKCSFKKKNQLFKTTANKNWDILHPISKMAKRYKRIHINELLCILFQESRALQLRAPVSHTVRVELCAHYFTLSVAVISGESSDDTSERGGTRRQVT